MTVFVFSDRPALLAELATGARGLAAQMDADVVAIAACPKAAEAASRLGVSRVMQVDIPAGRIVDDAAATVAGIASAPGSVLLVGATRRGKAVAARVAAIAGTSVLADAKALKWQGGKLVVEHSLYGGAAVYTEAANTGLAIATIAPGLFEPAPAEGEAPIENVPFEDGGQRITLLESRAKDGASVDLSAQAAIVCVGKGCGDQRGVDLARGLAKLLGGEVAYSRPVAEASDSPVLGADYIGVSGVQVKPDLYLAMGVSGQTQHMMGAIDSRIVVAINKDANAPIFRQCDYGIVGDAYEVVPVLAAAIQKA